MAIIDATDHVVGRLSSLVAKRLLEGEEITIVNAEKALVTGKRSSLFREYLEKREIGSQRKGPFYPRRADRILDRAIRGMIPYQRPRGREAHSRLRVYVDVPEELKGQSFERLPEASEVQTPYRLTLAEISKRLGAKF